MKKTISLEQEINNLKERNKKVELDKAWETSTFRKILIATLTYFVVVLLFYFMGNSSPFINAIVPTIGYFISTLSILFFKNFWIKHFNNKK